MYKKVTDDDGKIEKMKKCKQPCQWKAGPQRYCQRFPFMSNMSDLKSHFC